MSRHAAPRPRRRWRFGQGRTRALVSLGALSLLGVSSTMAYWTDTATITTPTLQSGKLDLTAGPTTGAENLVGTGPNSWSMTAFTLADIVPGESVSKTIVVRNSGTAALTFNGVLTSTTNDLASGTTGLLVQVYDNSTAAAATGSQATGNRAGACSGGTQVYSQYVTTTSTTKLFTTPVALTTTGSTRNLCLRAELSTSAPNTMQGKSTSLTLALDAQQVAAP